MGRGTGESLPLQKVSYLWAARTNYWAPADQNCSFLHSSQRLTSDNGSHSTRLAKNVNKIHAHSKLLRLI